VRHMGNIRLTVSVSDTADWMYGDYFIIPVALLSREQVQELKSKYYVFKGDIVSSEKTEKAYYEK